MKIAFQLQPPLHVNRSQWHNLWIVRRIAKSWYFCISRYVVLFAFNVVLLLLLVIGSGQVSAAQTFQSDWCFSTCPSDGANSLSTHLNKCYMQSRFVADQWCFRWMYNHNKVKQHCKHNSRSSLSWTFGKLAQMSAQMNSSDEIYKSLISRAGRIFC